MSAVGGGRSAGSRPAHRRSPANYLRFSRHHRRQIWYRAGTNLKPVEKREEIPLYSELAFIGPDGQERLRIVGDRVDKRLRNVADPANTTYLSETYFREARDLPPGKIYVSHLTGWHVGREEQLRGAPTPEAAVEGARYQGVIRFAAPVHDAAGRLQGVVVLSLDHRHLMEFTQHITPTADRYVVFPSYDSGNYAFMFDDEGWIITHPKYWDIRGLDRQGRLVPPYTADSSPEAVEKGIIPYNLESRRLHPSELPGGRQRRCWRAAPGWSMSPMSAAREKIMAYAPIFYRRRLLPAEAASSAASPSVRKWPISISRPSRPRP